MLVAALSPHIAFFTLGTEDCSADGCWPADRWPALLDRVLAAREEHPGPDGTRRPVLLSFTPDLPLARAEALLGPALARGVAGAQVAGGCADGESDARLVGAPTRGAGLALVRGLRDAFGPGITLIGSGGIHAPADTLAQLAAGADLVQVHSGMVFAGPGLPKRINEAVALLRPSPHASPEGARTLGLPGWAWLALLGLGMIVGGILAWGVAATWVLLPYDEAFLGMTRDGVIAFDERLLQFMAHDRVTLAGTMLSIGILYAGLAWGGVRRGAHWAREAVRGSALIGFPSFFLFLGYGYFDPLHAAATLGLLPLLLIGLRGPVPPPAYLTPDLHNDRAWHRGLAGQLLFVALGVGLGLAGVTIATVGVTVLFVPEDLQFIGHTREAIVAANPRFVPLIAHDRAGLGGALVADGVAVLLAALWGFRRGARWLWWTLALGGGAGFLGAFSVHQAVGYWDAWHLAPAWAALVLYAAGLLLAAPYLLAQTPRLHAASPYQAARATAAGRTSAARNGVGVGNRREGVALAASSSAAVPPVNT